jgi:hypothetical protein
MSTSEEGGASLMAMSGPVLPYDKPFSTLLPLAPKVFVSQKRFSATPTSLFHLHESLVC